MRRNYSMPWRTLSRSLAGKRVRDSMTMHFGYKATYGEPAKQGVRLPDQAQGFLLLRRANLRTQARIAIMTLAGNSLSFSDVRKACKRQADEFIRDAKEHDTRGPHTVYVSRARAASVASEEQEGDSDVETAPCGPGQEKATSILKKPTFKTYCWLTKSHNSG